MDWNWKGLRRFSYGDWGAISVDEIGDNIEDLINNIGSIFARYITRGGNRFYIIKDMDKETLSILTSDEYCKPSIAA